MHLKQGTDGMKQPTEPIYTLPPRKWYTLEQAVKRINKLTGEEIEVADLLHYWKTNQLEICTAIEYKDFELDLGQLKIEPNKIKYFDVDFFFDDANYKLIRTNNFYFITTGKKQNDLLDCNMAGMIILSPSVNIPSLINAGFEFIAKEDKGIDLFFIDYFITEKEENTDRTYFKLILNESAIIPFSSLFILNNELDLFLQGKSNAIETASEIEKRKTTSPTIQENQINFIKGLLYLHYGIESPQDAKNSINTGKLGQDIARLKRENPNIEQEKNFKFPSSTGLFNWYNRT